MVSTAHAGARAKRAGGEDIHAAMYGPVSRLGRCFLPSVDLVRARISRAGISNQVTDRPQIRSFARTVSNSKESCKFLFYNLISRFGYTTISWAWQYLCGVPVVGAGLLNYTVSKLVDSSPQLGPDWRLERHISSRNIPVKDGKRVGGDLIVGLQSRNSSSPDFSHPSFLGYWKVCRRDNPQEVKNFVFQVKIEVVDSEITPIKTGLTHGIASLVCRLRGARPWSLQVSKESRLGKVLRGLSQIKLLGLVDRDAGYFSGYEILDPVCEAVADYCEACGITNLSLPVVRYQPCSRPWHRWPNFTAVKHETGSYVIYRGWGLKNQQPVRVDLMLKYQGQPIKLVRPVNKAVNSSG